MPTSTSERLNDVFARVFRERFFSDHWQKAPLVHSGAGSARIPPLLDLAEMDNLVSTLGSTDPGWLMLVKDGNNLPVKAYRTEDGLINLSAVYSHYANGYTIILTKIDRRNQRVGLFCKQLELFLMRAGCLLSRGIRANVYLTPKGSKGFPVHYDDHDVLILQAGGSKRWRIFEPLEIAPVKRFETPIAEHTLGRKLFEGMIGEGDLLYIPRGFYHDAQSTETYSLHLTLSVQPLKWLDVFQFLMEQQASFRSDLPLNLFRKGADPRKGANPREIRQSLEDMLRPLADPDAVADAVSRLRETFFKTSGIFPDNGFAQTGQDSELTIDSRVRKNKGAYCLLVGSGDELQLLYQGSGIKVPAALREVFRFIERTDDFSVHELPDVIDDESKLDLARELIRDHYLCMIE
jgi:ribosomal protein L16 Arg81 hydroxylase